MCQTGASKSFGIHVAELGRDLGAFTLNIEP